VAYNVPLSLNYLCPFESDLVRIGNSGDGGYLIPSRVLNEIEIIISIGISDDWTFEKRATELNPQIRVFGWDRTSGFLVFSYYALRAISDKLLRARSVSDLRQAVHLVSRWVRKGISFARFWYPKHSFVRKWVVGEPTGKDQAALSDCFSSVGNNEAFLVKIDIEGNEYSLASQLMLEIEARAKRIRCVVIEFHETDTRRDEFIRLSTHLCSLFRVAHFHENNFGGFSEDGFPRIVEITFVSPSLTNDSPSTKFPIKDLDLPCNPGAVDSEIVFALDREH